MSQVVKHLIDLLDQGLDFVIDLAQANPELTWLTVAAVCAGCVKLAIAMID